MISYEISGKTCSSVEVLLHVPSDKLPSLLQAIEKIDSSEIEVAQREKRVAALVESGLISYQQTKSLVVKTFKELVEHNHDPILSLSLTVRQLKPSRPNLCHDVVRSILSESGSLRESGYYQALKERKQRS